MSGEFTDSLMMKMIEAFRAIIVKAGYKFGIYCGYSWYQNQLPEGAKKYDCWVARYPNNDTGELQERLRVPASTGVIGWQYSSKATIPGIPTKTDRSVFYKDYSKSSTTSTNSPKPTTTQGSDTMNKEKAIDALIACAENEVGYLEKKSNSQLDDKTANAGYNNYTKYWRDVYPQYQAQAWCAAFLSWCMMKTFGLDVAKKLLKHWPYVYCPTLGNLFTKYANPQRGDIVIFYRRHIRSYWISNKKSKEINSILLKVTLQEALLLFQMAVEFMLRVIIIQISLEQSFVVQTILLSHLF